MKTGASLVAALGLLALACGGSGSSPGPYGAGSGARTASPSTPAASSAADLRTHLNLLLGEQVMIVAKETAAAANHEDTYGGYTALLTSNQTDLDNVIRTAFGDTAADSFTKGWSVQNTSLVDYGIGVVTHNDSKSAHAMSDLNGAVQQLSSRIVEISGLPPDSVTLLLTQQAADDKAFIDDAGAQKYSSFYADLQTAYFASERLGDALAARIADRFPDRFPGDPTVPAVDRRVLLNVLLQQHALVATMATDATIGARDADRAAATSALNTNGSGISRMVNLPNFAGAWSARVTALIAYAQKGDTASRQMLAATGPQVATSTAIGSRTVMDQLTAQIKVIDDQRTKASDRVAGDDRAAATSMQPIADGIVFGPTN